MVYVRTDVLEQKSEMQQHIVVFLARRIPMTPDDAMEELVMRGNGTEHARAGSMFVGGSGPQGLLKLKGKVQ